MNGDEDEDRTIAPALTLISDLILLTLCGVLAPAHAVVPITSSSLP